MTTLETLIKKAFSFSSIGLVMTLTSLALNYILIRYFGFEVRATYVSVYATLLLVSFLLNSRYTFKNTNSVTNLAKYVSVYLLGMLLGTILLEIYINTISLQPQHYVFLVVPFTASWNFFASNKLLTGKLV